MLTVSNDVDDTEDQSVLGPHRDIAAVSVSRNGGLGGSGRQEFVHLSDAPDLFARGVDGEDEYEDDREEDGGVGAGFAEKVRPLLAEISGRTRPY